LKKGKIPKHISASRCFRLAPAQVFPARAISLPRAPLPEDWPRLASETLFCRWTPVGRGKSFIETARRLRQFGRVKIWKLFAWCWPIALIIGCQKAPPPAPPENSMPTHAQPKLPTMKIYLGAEVLDAELALTPREQEIGMMFRTNVTDQSAMLFVLPQPLLPPNGFWMTNCPVSLSAAYIGPDGVIEEIQHLEKNDNTPVLASHNNILYVLEVNDGWFARHHIGVGTLVRTERGSLAETFWQK
jgi:uncharacterized membrane protein (UPF0127 family)